MATRARCVRFTGTMYATDDRSKRFCNKTAVPQFFFSVLCFPIRTRSAFLVSDLSTSVYHSHPTDFITPFTNVLVHIHFILGLGRFFSFPPPAPFSDCLRCNQWSFSLLLKHPNYLDLSFHRWVFFKSFSCIHFLSYSVEWHRPSVSNCLHLVYETNSSSVSMSFCGSKMSLSNTKILHISVSSEAYPV